MRKPSTETDGGVDVSRITHTDGGIVHGTFHWWLRDDRGRFVQRGVGHNRNKTNNNFLAALTQWSIGVANVGVGSVAPYPTQMQLGTGTGTPSGTDPGLFTPTAGTIVPITNFSVYQTFYAQYLAYWGSTTPAGNYTEAGLQTASGALQAHVLLQTSASQPYITIQAGQTLSGLWKIQFLGN